MNLLQGTGRDTVELTKKVTVNYPVSGSSTVKQVKFAAVFEVPVDPEELKAIRKKLLDEDDPYDDADLVSDYLLRIVDMPGANGELLPNDDDEIQAQMKIEAIADRYYLSALANKCGEAIFSNEARRKN